ncbi:vanadium-dependent haloperoxidase, partial [Longimicrobium sp.]|uniref:vanadium-dependent haloperoxidase n=1 Tax=Longimicrobium sp. TaxID=2029185 RepID=UPI002F9295AE
RHEEHANNNDEVNYPDSLAGSYSKSLKHDPAGNPDAISYASMLRALESRDPADFEEIILGSPSAVKLTNPQAGLAFDIEGPNAQELTLPPAPRFDSIVAAHEAGELYWMAVARDVHFATYATDPYIAAAVASLNSEFPQFGGTTPVTAQNVFRGIFAGEQVGPYVSQFLLKGNTDPRKPDGLGRDANEGFISYGSRVIDQRQIPAAAGADYLTDFTWWRDVQNGVDKRGLDAFDTSRRFIRNLRDGATFVHFDQVLDAFYNAAWILMSEPTGNQLALQAGITGRPQIDGEFPYDQGNPYMPPLPGTRSRTQGGFATFGPTHLLQVLGEVLGRALRAVWWQKWGVHRRLRPEEYGGRIDNIIAGRGTYPVHASITDSLLTGGLSPYFGHAGERFPSSYLLPQAYPEGAPTHPAYGAGHASGSGAMATILKAFFDDTKAIENPLHARSDGLALIPYSGTDAGQMTVGGELNKLAGNISLFRNAAGVHWRTDHTESLLLGEKVGIRLLQEMSLGFNEDNAFFEITRLDGNRIRIFDGKVVPAL